MRILAVLAALVWAAEAQTGEAGLRLPPVKTSIDIGGRSIVVTAWGEVFRSSAGLIRVTLTADLSSLQDNMTELLRSQLNRSDRCGERLSVEQASIEPAGAAGILTVNVHYERWGCAKAFGKEVVKRLVGGNGTVVVRLTPAVEAGGISLESEVQRIDADGSLGELLRSGSLGAAVKEKITTSVRSAIQKVASLGPALPADVAGAAVIRSAQFADGGGGRLRMAVEGELQIPDEQFRRLTSR